MKYDVLVIGAGQAGLAMGYHLQRTSLCYQLVDSHTRIGESWRQRYDSLTLFTPRCYSALPGLTLTGDPWGYATKDEFADYLERYAHHFALPVSLDTKIVELGRGDGLFAAQTAGGKTLTSHAVVIASGAFQQAAIPAIAQRLASDVQQLSTEQYQNPDQIASGVVLVVGDGASGRDIASELSATHTVILATGRPRRLLPDRILGMNVWWLFDKTGLLRLSGETALGQYVRKTDPFPRRGKHTSLLRQKGIRVVGRVAELRGRTATFGDGTTTQIDTVIWATGYQDRFDWITVPGAIDAHGRLVHHRGISTVPGLYTIGRPWQRNRGSALITGVGGDAAFVTEQLSAALKKVPENAWQTS